jgi:outer membrane receptor for ferrienterochelin and colicins
LQPGVDINYETGSGGRIKTGTQSIGDYALFLSGEWKISRSVQMRAGARSIYNTVYSAPPVVPSFNFKIRLSENNDLRLSYGRGFRAPSLRELYFNFFDASHSIEGNPNLKAELSHSINASWTSRMVKEDGHSYVSVVGSFYNSVNNMIGYGQLPGNPLITSYINIDRYKTEGLTWTNTLKWKHLDISAGAGYTGRYNQLAESSNDVNEFCWSPEVTSNVNYRIPKYSLSVAFYYKYTGRLPYYQIDPATNQAMLAKISPYNWADLTVQKSFLQHWNLSVGARNLLNIVSVNNSSGIAPSAHGTGGAQPIAYGRSYFFSISYSLNKL